METQTTHFPPVALALAGPRYRWSIVGKLILLLGPILVWLVAASSALDLQPLIAPQNTHPTFFVALVILSNFVLRIFSMFLFLFGLLLVLREPSSSIPKWMKVSVRIKD